jgi:sporulation protein YlmC with PRC-barrel domain
VKKVVIAFTATLLGLGVASGAWAQSRPTTSETKQVDDAQRQAWTPDPNGVETSKIIGTKVKTPDGKSVGAIDQLIVSQHDGKITHAVIGKGGVLGMGETKLVFKWSDVKLQRDPDAAERWVAVIDQAKLDAAPRYEARKDRDTAPAASPSAAPPPAGRTKEPAKKY